MSTAAKAVPSSINVPRDEQLQYNPTDLISTVLTVDSNVIKRLFRRPSKGITADGVTRSISLRVTVYYRPIKQFPNVHLGEQLQTMQAK